MANSQSLLAYKNRLQFLENLLDNMLFNLEVDILSYQFHKWDITYEKKLDIIRFMLLNYAAPRGLERAVYALCVDGKFNEEQIDIPIEFKVDGEVLAFEKELPSPEDAPHTYSIEFKDDVTQSELADYVKRRWTNKAGRRSRRTKHKVEYSERDYVIWENHLKGLKPKEIADVLYKEKNIYVDATNVSSRIAALKKYRIFDFNDRHIKELFSSRPNKQQGQWGQLKVEDV